MRVLLVDDNEDWRVDFTEWLTEELGYKVLATEDSAEAIELFRADQNFQAALVDYSLRLGEDGIALLKMLHEIDGDLPVILITGIGERKISKRALESGAYWYLEKPIDKTEAKTLLGQLARSGPDRRSGDIKAEREVYLRLLEALEICGKKLAQTQKEEEIYKVVERVIFSSFRIDTFYLALLHKPTETIYFPIVIDEGKVKSLLPRSAKDDGLTAAIIRQGQELDVPDLQLAKKLPSQPCVDGRPARAFFGVPLRLSDDRCIGALSIEDYEPDHFSMTTRRAIRALAQQIAFHLDRLTRLGLREAVLEELMAGKDLREVLQGITIALENAIGAQAVAIHPFNADTHKISQISVCSNPKARSKWLLPNGLLEALEKHGGKLTSDIASERVFSRKLMNRLGSTLAYGQLLKTHRRNPVGVLTVYYNSPAGESEVAKQEIEWFARRAALATYLGQLLDQQRQADHRREVEYRSPRAGLRVHRSLVQSSPSSFGARVPEPSGVRRGNVSRCG